MIKHISPSSLYTFEHNTEEFYDRYFLDGARMPATPAMRLGSAFDAQVKAWLRGETCEYADPDESVNDSARHILTDYQRSGVGMELLDALDRAADAEMDKEVRGEIAGVPILGYIDLMWYDEQTRILDWKVGKIRAKPSPYWVDQLHIYGMLVGCRSLTVHQCQLDKETGSTTIREHQIPWNEKLAAKLTDRIKRAWETAHDPAWHSLFAGRARLLSQSGDVFNYLRKFGMY